MRAHKLLFRLQTPMRSHPLSYALVEFEHVQHFMRQRSHLIACGKRGWEWMRVDESGWERMTVGDSGWEWMRVDGNLILVWSGLQRNDHQIPIGHYQNERELSSIRINTAVALGIVWRGRYSRENKWKFRTSTIAVYLAVYKCSDAAFLFVPSLQTIPSALPSPSFL